MKFPSIHNGLDIVKEFFIDYSSEISEKVSQFRTKSTTTAGIQPLIPEDIADELNY